MTVTAGYIYRKIWVRGSQNTKFMLKFDAMIRNTPLYAEITAIRDQVGGIDIQRLENTMHTEIEDLKKCLPPSVDVEGLESRLQSAIDAVRDSIPPSPDLDALEKKLLSHLITLREGVQSDFSNFQIPDDEISKIGKNIKHRFDSEKGGVMSVMSKQYKAEGKDMAELEVTQYPSLLWALQNIEGLVDAGYIKAPAAQKLLDLASNSMWQPRLENVAKGIREMVDGNGGSSSHGSGMMSWK